MDNPWELIDLEIYEKHMSSDEVYQLQTLNLITQEQLSENNCEIVGILGVAGGNGLDKIDPAKTKRVYAIDINKTYLEKCRQRYGYLGDSLELLNCDLAAAKTELPYTSLLICNLIIEYTGEREFVTTIARNKNKTETVSCVIQKNNSTAFVSQSTLASHFEPIASLHRDIDSNSLTALFSNHGFVCSKQQIYHLPNGKDFLRIDFVKRGL
ncbi:class I SAM-dependent methyltransferase [Sporomusa aerivorans]|uniref:class I SAM-dependent methyltransferase n=1 Tax=Sporomusa aerivorans TaxID=204936 RepID=UPI00352A4A56